MNKVLGVALVTVGMSLSVEAQERGRGTLATETPRTAEVGRAALPAAKHETASAGSAWGVRLALGWASVDWDVGPVSGAETLFVPQAAVFYRVTDPLELNGSLLLISAEDEDGVFGKNGADLTRLGLGVRYWVRTPTRITPYVGGGLGYALTDGQTERTRHGNGDAVAANVADVKDVPSMFLEGGAAFQADDHVFVTAGLSYDMLLGSADATLNGETADYDVTVLAVSVGVMWMF